MYIEVNREQNRDKENTEMVKGKLEGRMKALVLEQIL
jgi:hypothetical protein